MLDRTTAPVVHSYNIDIRHSEDMTMQNGVKMSCVKLDDTHLVRLDFYFKGGQWLQDKQLQARLAFSQLKSGSKSMSCDVIDERLDYYGATINVISTLSYSTVVAQCLDKNLDGVLDILRSIFDAPMYDAERFALAVEEMKTGYSINSCRTDYQCKTRFYSALYGADHPMGVNTTISDYDSITVDDLKSYRSKYIGSNNCHLILSGNVCKEVVDKVSSRFGVDSWGCDVDKVESLAPYVTPDLTGGIKIRHVMDKPTVQSSVRIGCRLPATSHADTPFIKLYMTILGGYFGSRLMSNIREDKGYTYGISCRKFEVPFQPTFVILSDCANEYLVPLIAEVRKELERLICAPVGEAELSMVKNIIGGQMCHANDGGFNQIMSYINILSSGITIDDYVRSYEIIKQATADDVMRIAREYFAPNALVECAVVGAE